MTFVTPDNEPYGVTSRGFNRKPLSVILAEIQQANIDIFGPGIIQTEQSPMGQLNGLRADLIATLWEAAEDVYQSLDPDQAEGTRLDTQARIRLISRMVGESDESLRRAITNAGLPNTRDADFDRAIKNVDGVTWSRVYSNDTGSVDANGMPPHSVSVAAIGGDIDEIAAIIRQFVVPGITVFGNTIVSTVIDGFCRSMQVIRPVEVPVFIDLTVEKTSSRDGCPPPSNNAIAQLVRQAFAGQARPANGEYITLHMLNVIISCVYPNVRVVSALGGRVGDTSPEPLPITIDFFEIASLALDDITITAV